jgi:L-aminopeptidase/D-esterase-like protein
MITIKDSKLSIGYYPEGKRNLITDVPGVYVGLVNPTQQQQNNYILDGITIIDIHNVVTNPVPAGGFILNGIGEVIGLKQVMECGFMDTPIALTSTTRLGDVYNAMFRWLHLIYPDRVEAEDLIIPVVGETDNSFLSAGFDFKCMEQDAIGNLYSHPDIIRNCKCSKSFYQGSVGGGLGMMTYGFSGGTGSASRKLSVGKSCYYIGVLTQSNFGELRDFTVNGKNIGCSCVISTLCSCRLKPAGSAIVVVATNAPLLPTDLTRIAKRAALGLGKAGSRANTGSGEIIIAFSTSRSLAGVNDQILDDLFSMTIEATEESVLQAVFNSNQITGKTNRKPAEIPKNIAS